MISDPIPFLANIACVAYADGKLSPSELGQIEAIRTEFKFKKSDYSAAIRLAEQGAHKMTPVGSFADQVRNLECIIRVAYADDDLDEKEAALIGEFCKAVGVYQDQLDKICREVLASLKKEAKERPACGSAAESEARFCPKCGKSLTPDDPVVPVAMDIPTTGIAIEFAESSAVSFPKALELAKATNGFQTCQRNKKAWYLAVYPSGSIAEALPLAEEVSGIRNRRLYVDGQEQPWDEVFGFSWCACQRAGAYRPIEFCFGKDENRINPWGCKQARLDWTEWASWFSYGTWEKGGVLGRQAQWRFDKERIRHELATNLFRYRFCPHFCATLPEAVLHHLPDVVRPDADLNWQFSQHHEEVPGSIKVTQHERSGDFNFTNEFWSDGVRPRGLKALADILSRALTDLGREHVSAQLLLT
jgi:uncharacterized tellurite resistance protein B-like protein